MSDTINAKAAHVAVDLAKELTEDELRLGFMKILASALVPKTPDEFIYAVSLALVETLDLTEEEIQEIEASVIA